MELKKDIYDHYVRGEENKMEKEVISAKEYCQCLYADENNLDRNFSCFMACDGQTKLLQYRRLAEKYNIKYDNNANKAFEDLGMDLQHELINMLKIECLNELKFEFYSDETKEHLKDHLMELIKQYASFYDDYGTESIQGILMKKNIQTLVNAYDELIKNEEEVF